MLLVQAKVKTIAEKNSFDVNNNPLVGTQLSEMTENETIAQLITKGVLKEEDIENANIYVWQQTEIDQEALTEVKLKDAFYIVNYETEDIIYSKGFKTVDGNVYYKLSETLNLK